ncbi:MAG: QueT transporter family protein [Candidatus Bathyarchaeota archaeon]|nr:MAG: QueT transporter family protein [Candidatus Bathyarchaeota archaeon]
MRVDSKDVTLVAMIAGLYFVINLIQAVTVGNPAISGPVQLRISDCLIPLSALLGWPVAVGVTLGAALTNAYAFINPVDVVFGSLANFIAASIVIFLRKRSVLACVAAAFPIGVIVGGYLSLFGFDPPEIFGLTMLPWAAMMVSITLSSLIAVSFFGYIILRILSSPGVIEPLRSRGLKILT